jgi:hypothetical protein
MECGTQEIRKTQKTAKASGKIITRWGLAKDALILADISIFLISLFCP